DQVGNRPWGERVSRQLPDEALRMWSAIMLLSPHIPLLFMGEEWKAGTPFLFFSDVGDDMAEVIRDSRKKELKNYHDARAGNLPDPMSIETFNASKLDWDELDQPEHRAMLDHYRELIALRQKIIVPRLHGMAGHSGHYEVLSDRL